MSVCIHDDDVSEVHVSRVASATKPWKSHRQGKYSTSYHTPEEIGIAPELITEYDAVIQGLTDLSFSDHTIIDTHSKREALYQKSKAIHLKWKAAALQWLAWKRRRAAIAAWHLAREE